MLGVDQIEDHAHMLQHRWYLGLNDLCMKHEGLANDVERRQMEAARIQAEDYANGFHNPLLLFMCKFELLQILEY